MLYILAGKSCSGKDTIKKTLMKEYHFKDIISYTTRPMRDGEVDGKTYHFITQENFQDMIDKGQFFEYTSYEVANGETWYYGTTNKDVLKAENDDYIVILNPKGVEYYKENLDIPMKIFYIYSNRKTITERLKQRGDDSGESKRRVEADNKDFKGFEEIADRIIYNNLNDDIDDLVETIFHYINFNDR